MSAKVVRKSDLSRVLDVLETRGLRPAAFTLLPSGNIHLHLTDPAGADLAPAEPEEANEWDAALA
jgi:methanogenic corrinoid protein MtbC1